MILKIVTLILINFILFDFSSGYLFFKTNSKFVLNSNSANKPNYKDLINRSKDKGQDPSFEVEEETPKYQKPSIDLKSLREEAMSITESSQFKNKIPFSEDIYVHLKFVIETLSARMKDKKPLSQDTFKKFESAVEIIITEARNKK